MSEDIAPHPAPYTDVIIERFAQIVHENYACAMNPVKVLDPFAGIGGIHKIPLILCGCDLAVQTFGIELEPRWANAHPRTKIGSALLLPWRSWTFDCIMTSPCYGNRMADHHNAKDGSKRITYTHYYGEKLSDQNAGVLQWGEAYREFHRAAWNESFRVLRPGGLFVVNISDHVRGGKIMPVVEFHLETLLDLGLTLEADEKIKTPRMRNGANAHLRVPYEHILVMRKDG